MTLLQEMLDFTMSNTPSNASNVFTARAKKTNSPRELRSLLAQVVQSTLAGQIRKQEFDTLKAFLEQKLSAVRAAGKTVGAEKQIIPTGVQHTPGHSGNAGLAI